MTSNYIQNGDILNVYMGSTKIFPGPEFEPRLFLCAVTFEYHSYFTNIKTTEPIREVVRDVLFLTPEAVIKLLDFGNLDASSDFFGLGEDSMHRHLCNANSQLERTYIDRGVLPVDIEANKEMIQSVVFNRRNLRPLHSPKILLIEDRFDGE